MKFEDGHRRQTFLIKKEGGGVAAVPEPKPYPPGTPIDTMLEAPIYGNAYSDSTLNVALLKYAVNTRNPIDKRRAAVIKLHELIGEPIPGGTDLEVMQGFMKTMWEFLDELQEDNGDVSAEVDDDD